MMAEPLRVGVIALAFTLGVLVREPHVPPRACAGSLTAHAPIFVQGCLTCCMAMMDTKGHMTR